MSTTPDAGSSPDANRDSDLEPRSATSPDAADIVPPSSPRGWNTQDWWSVALGGLILAVSAVAVLLSPPADQADRITKYQAAQQALDQLIAGGQAERSEIKAAEKAVADANKSIAGNPLSAWVGKTSSWNQNPVKAFIDKSGRSSLPALVAMFLTLGLLFGWGAWAQGRPLGLFIPGFVVLTLLAVFAQVLADQAVIRYYNLEFALWALAVGLAISNTVGTPLFLKSAANTEFYIKTGLVLLGAEVLFHKLLQLGIPGICVAWVVTPIVLITTYQFGQRILKIESRSLNMVISADMSVCGVSAAIATAAACKAKKEELSLAIGLSLTFTVVMMVVLPAVIRAAGMSEVLGGAWIGGTIDSTGAVAAAGELLGPTALQVAATVKMIQNILIGAVAFGVAVYWVTYVERDAQQTRPRFSEVWQRFPRFIFGFLAASVIFSTLSAQGAWGDAVASSVIDGTSKTIRSWCFCLAFVSIGLETNFRELSRFLSGGKPLILYVCGQSLNLLLTLFMAWLMFEKVFPHAADSLVR